MDDKLTIVGPEPIEPDNKKRSRNVNIEALLLMAKYNDEFQQLLLNDRDKALKESGIDFSKGEEVLLKNIENKQLKEHIEKFEVKGITKKSLKNWACAASIVLLLSTLLTNCSGSGSGVVTGIGPDTDTSDTSIVINGIFPDAIDTSFLNLENH